MVAITLVVDTLGSIFGVMAIYRYCITGFGNYMITAEQSEKLIWLLLCGRILKCPSSQRMAGPNHYSGCHSLYNAVISALALLETVEISDHNRNPWFTDCRYSSGMFVHRLHGCLYFRILPIEWVSSRL